MTEPHKTREPAINRENKASAMRWAIGVIVVLVLGAAAWVMSDHRGELGDLTPQEQPASGDQPSQPPAVAPDADSNTGTLDAPPPASSGAGTQ
jgi:hypothetical protein